MFLIGPLGLALITAGSRLGSTALGSAMAPDAPGGAPSIGGFPGQGSGIDSQIQMLQGRMTQQNQLQQQLKQQMLAQLIQSIMAQSAGQFGGQQGGASVSVGDPTPVSQNAQPPSKFGETSGGLLQGLMQSGLLQGLMQPFGGR